MAMMDTMNCQEDDYGFSRFSGEFDGSPSLDEFSSPYNLPILEEPQIEDERQQMIAHSMKIVNDVFIALERQKDSLGRCSEEIQQLFRAPDKVLQRHLYEKAEALLKDVHAEQAALEELMEQCHLTPRELHAINFFQTELHIQQTQLEIYLAEIDALFGTDGAPLLALVISNQPFPSVIRQKRTIDQDELTVRLLTGATVHIHDISPVSCAVFGLEDTSAADKNMIEGSVQAMDSATRTARFPLTFVEGTRKVAAHVRFNARVELEQLQGRQSLSADVCSPPSKSFVVMTNQKQWEDCEKHLFYMDAFGGNEGASWFRFANTLQRHILLATKQELAAPQRPLSSYDFAYIHTQFFDRSERIAASGFGDFWTWYGKTLQVLRYQRHVCEMWINGYIYGYMSREDVLAALSRQPPGTFVLRFSERYPGQFAVGYVHSDENVHHYLVKAIDTAGAKITLADFLQRIPQFTHVNKFDTVENAPFFTRLAKGGVLETYCSNVNTERTSGSGYDELIS